MTYDAAVKENRHIARMDRIRRETEGCVAVMSSDHSRDCPHKVVAIVHPPPGVDWPPERKCQYHLDVMLRFGPRPHRVEVQ